MMRHWFLIASLIGVILSGAIGYRTGVRVEAGRAAIALAKAQKDAFRAAEIASEAEEKRLNAEFQRAQAMIQLEDEANADANANLVCLGADSVMRLKKR
ncbi:hypothetical protein JZU54_04805 [bacterium]|jgi:regulator of protease activity HflC (stomatin/prohibitin superfamily)|nr:hypothetical protein [bacterium]